jgi:threonine/homoserine/homoserine lactone efflux protein
MNAGSADALALGSAAFFVGLSGAMAPGPFLTVTISRTLTRGPASAALMLVGHALLEGALLVSFAFGLHRLLAAPVVNSVLGVVGGAILLWLALGLTRDTLSGATIPGPGAVTPEPKLGPVIQGVTVSLSNPYWTLWWATVGVKLASDGLAIGAIGVAAFFIGHQMADVVWYGLVIAATARGRRVLPDRAYQVLLGSCAVFLAYLGLRFAIAGIASLG